MALTHDDYNEDNFNEFGFLPTTNKFATEGSNPIWHSAMELDNAELSDILRGLDNKIEEIHRRRNSVTAM